MKHDVVLVLGMHRSGTSCLAGSLQAAGLYLGEVHVADPFNRKGNRENDRIVALNDAVLARSGGDWSNVPTTLAWDEAHEAERNAIVAAFDVQAPGAWGFKDPRMVVTLPFWLPALGGRVRFVGTFRHPSQVVRSLCSRGHMSLQPGPAAELWTAYNTRLLDQAARYRFPLISFDLPPAAYGERIRALSAFLRLPGATHDSGKAFFDEELRAGTGVYDGFVAGDAELALHARLLEASEASWRTLGR